MDCSLPGSSLLGDPPGKNPGVGCYALLKGFFITQGLNPGLSNCSQILYCLSHQENPWILEWAANLFSRGSSWPRNQTGVSCIAGRLFTNWITREALSVGYCSCFSRPVMSEFLQLHGLQHTKPHCPSANSCSLCWCDLVQPSHPLMPSSPSAFNLSQHQGLFQWVSSSHQVAKVLELQLQH